MSFFCSEFGDFHAAVIDASPHSTAERMAGLTDGTTRLCDLLKDRFLIDPPSLGTGFHQHGRQPG